MKVSNVILFLKNKGIAAVPFCVAATNGTNKVIRKIAFNDVMYVYLCECQSVHITA